MIKLKFHLAIILCAAFCVTFFMNACPKFILLTVLYNETHPERIQEYITCLNRNIAHPQIESIHVLYDRSNPASAQGYGRQERRESYLLDYLKTQSVKITYIDDRPTFGDCFDVVNKQYPNRKIIISNADIYFNDTLRALENYDFNNVFMALTRWNVGTDGALEIFKQYHWNGGFDEKASFLSQDVWIFQTPLRPFANPSFRLGTWACDGYIAYQAYLAQLNVINPCLTVQCCHLHQSGVRHWTPQSIPGAKALILPWSSL